MTPPTPPPTTPGHTGDDGRTDFDFLLGTWRVANRRLCHPLESSDGPWEEFRTEAVVRPVLGGLGNTDTLVSHSGPNGEPVEGLTLRLFDPSDGTWRIWWTSTRQPGRLDPPMTGGFAGTHGIFFGTDEVEGQPIRVRFDWYAQTDERARWEQAFSLDDGATWTTNWIMNFTRSTAGD